MDTLPFGPPPPPPKLFLLISLLLIFKLLLFSLIGTENPAEDDDRIKVAVDKAGGSYCITQRWIHKFDVIQGAKGKKISDTITESRRESRGLLYIIIYNKEKNL